jgi:hypothetical protein
MNAQILGETGCVHYPLLVLWIWYLVGGLTLGGLFYRAGRRQGFREATAILNMGREPGQARCDKAARGWKCARSEGHEGACFNVPDEQVWS